MFSDSGIQSQRDSRQFKHADEGSENNNYLGVTDEVSYEKLLLLEYYYSGSELNNDSRKSIHEDEGNESNIYPGIEEKIYFERFLSKTNDLNTVTGFQVFLSNSNNLHPLIWFPDIGIMVRVFANGPGDLGSIQCQVIPKTQKIVLDATLLNT